MRNNEPTGELFAPQSPFSTGAKRFSVRACDSKLGTQNTHYIYFAARNSVKKSRRIKNVVTGLIWRKQRTEFWQMCARQAILIKRLFA
jgi:hypothetical protein